jgi:5-methylcytosine-specific restriction endonuclease McrA
MAKRQRAWARRTSAYLRALLGNQCALCGALEPLTFDCIVPPPDGGDRHHKIEWSWRISFYRSQLAAGNLQLLCDSCNSAKGDRVTLRTIAGPRSVIRPTRSYSSL